jgi:hypothetical protein
VKTTEFATLIGVSRQAVLEAIKRGRLPKSARKVGEHWHIDPALGKIEFAKNVDAAKRPPRDEIVSVVGGDDDYPDFNESRAKREFHMAALAELDHSERSGTLVNAEEVRRSAFKLARQARDGMLNIADRVAADLAAETDAFKVHARLTKEIREALSALALVADESDFPESVQ